MTVIKSPLMGVMKNVEWNLAWSADVNRHTVWYYLCVGTLKLKELKNVMTPILYLEMVVQKRVRLRKGTGV